MQHSRIRSIGVYIPSKQIDNAYFSKFLDTDDEWIVKRTGIKTRYFVEDGVMASDCALHAAQDVLRNSDGLTVGDIGGIILATTTADSPMPSCAALLHGKLGCAQNTFAFDIHSACSGFVYAIAVADSLIKSSIADKILIVGAETMSHVLDWTDRSSCILFGDGAGAILLESTDSKDNGGIIYSKMYADGGGASLLYMDGNSEAGTIGKIRMNGQAVFVKAVECLSSAILSALKDTGLTVGDIDFVVPHQANARIISAVADKIPIPREKMLSVVEYYANTSAASVPLTLAKYVTDGTIKRGSIIMFAAVGAGMTWAISILKY